VRLGQRRKAGDVCEYEGRFAHPRWRLLAAQGFESVERREPAYRASGSPVRTERTTAMIAPLLTAA
jgi:hypothetical protein